MKKVFSIHSVIMLVIAFPVAVLAQNTPIGPVTTAPSPTVSTVSLPVLSGVNTSSLNFTRTYIPLVPTTDVANSMFNLAPGLPTSYAAGVATTYTNGWGKPVQSIERGYPTNSVPDVVTPVDNTPSLTSTGFLPYSAPLHSQFQTTAFTDQQSYYLAKAPDENGFTYSQSVQSFPSQVPTTVSYAPGSGLAGQGIGTTVTTTLNTATQGIVIYNVVAGEDGPQAAGVYADNTLTVKTTADADGGAVMEFFDEDGREVCKQVYTYDEYWASYEWMTTYYVYDILGRITYIITPQAVASGDVTGTLQTLSYSYAYDGFNKLISSNTPGKSAADAFVYDSRHLCVLSQTPLQQTEGVWTFYLYDSRDRLAIKGTVTSSATAEEWQTNINDGIAATEGPDQIGPYLLNGAPPPTAYPTSISNCEFDVINYYDQYLPNTNLFNNTFSSDYLSNVTYATATPTPYYFTEGMLTESRVRVKDPTQTDAWVTNVYFYDQKGELIQTQTVNPWSFLTPSVPGSKDPTRDPEKYNWDVHTMQYNFSGQKAEDILQYYDVSTGNKPSTKIVTKYVYNQFMGDRLQNVNQSIDNSLPVTIATYQYDDLGRVKQKSLGGVELQNYTYNIRNQLTSINADYVNNGCGTLATTSSFGCILSYDHGFSEPRYGGGISGIYWRGAGGHTPIRSYGYQYDISGRLTDALFQEYDDPSYAYPSCGGISAIPYWNNTLTDYSVSNISYDLNGNLQSMNQQGTTPTGPVAMDQLTYHYLPNSNLLGRVDDGISTNYGLGDFTGSSLICTSCTDYGYDGDGNMTADNHKAMALTYNDQDLPLSVTATGQGTINNVYDATGTLIKKTIVDDNAGTTSTYRYWGPFVYLNDQLQYTLHDEGRARWDATSSAFTYDYFVKDHLGNVRTVVTSGYANTKHYYATHEVVNAVEENQVFVGIPEVRAGKPDGDTTDSYAALLNAGTANRLGTSLMLQVMAGDQFDISAQSYWDTDSTEMNIAAPEDILGDLLLGFTYFGTPGTLGADGSLVAQLNSTLTPGIYDAYSDMINRTSNPDIPQAFINYLVFDQDMNLMEDQSGAIQIGATAGAWQNMQIPNPVTPQQNGYLVVYMSNEEDNNVYFDNMNVNLYKGKVLQEQQYYPFGLTINEGQDATTIPNKYLYQGKEMQDQLGMDLYDFHARQYDPQIGRFWSVDPASQFPSGYTGMGNDPGNQIDPTGAWSNVVNNGETSGAGGATNWAGNNTSESDREKEHENDIATADGLELKQLVDLENQESNPGTGTSEVGTSTGLDNGTETPDYIKTGMPNKIAANYEEQNAYKPNEDVASTSASTSPSTSLMPDAGDGSGNDDKNWKQDKKLTPGEIDMLKKSGLWEHRDKGDDGASTDLYKDKDGNIYQRPKSGVSGGEPIGINVNDLNKAMVTGVGAAIIIDFIETYSIYGLLIL